MLPKISGKEALLVQGGAGENNSGAAAPVPRALLCPLWDGHSCPGAGWEQFSHGMGTSVQLCCTHPVSWSRVGDVIPIAPFPLSLFPDKHPSTEESCQLKCPFSINLHIFSLPIPFSLCLSLEYS